MVPQISTRHGIPADNINVRDAERSNSFEMHSLRRSSRDTHRSGTYDSDDDVDDADKRFLSPSARRDSETTSQDFRLYAPEEEAAVLRKLDTRFLPFLALLYLLSFLDRSNIGNAKIAGMEEDLRLSSSQYEWLLTAFYITYILFEWMTLMYRLVPPHIYISLCVGAWGLLASLQSVTTSFASLLTLRALLGISEAAFGPGVPFYLSFFFRRNELAFRTGLFISAAPLATSFASSLAWAITKFGEDGPIAPWRLLFLIEGFPSVVVSVFAWSFIPDRPESASFFSEREREVAGMRLQTELVATSDVGVAEKMGRGGRISQRARGIDLKEVLQTLKDPKCYMAGAMFFCCNVAFSSMPVFLPTIIKEMGYSALSAQALSAPPYLVSFVVVIVTAFFSDRTQRRGSFIILHALLAASGYLLIVVAGLCGWSDMVRYIGIYPATAGFFSAITILITWLINNQDSESKRGTGMAMLNVFGQCGPLLGTRLYPASDRPLYVKGMATCSGVMFVVAGLAFLLRRVLAKENARRERSRSTQGAFRYIL